MGIPRFIVTVLAAMIMIAFGANSQDINREDGVPGVGTPSRIQPPPPLPVTGMGITIIPRNEMTYSTGPPPPVFGEKFIPDLEGWQREFRKNNKLDHVAKNPTVVDPEIMGNAVKYKTPNNEQFYRNYVIMNQRAVGNTQLQRMNVKMRAIPTVGYSYSSGF
ncbi:MAG: hypothetical protein LUF87_09870 [Alistipes sp.]|nr:hypothetical protein [Alistipes sp.]